MNTSAEILFTNPRWKYILKRLVYVAEAPHPGAEQDDEGIGLAFALEPGDECAELGVIWLTPQQVEAAAKELAIELPEGWQQDEVAGRPILKTRSARSGDSLREQRKPASEENEDIIPDDNPLAQALRRAMQQE